MLLMLRPLQTVVKGTGVFDMFLLRSLTMADHKTPKTRVRGLFGQAMQQHLDGLGVRQEDLAARVQASGLASWDQAIVSRFIAGRRMLSLEDAITIAAALGVPLVELLPGDELVTLGGVPVPVQQVRDVLAYGRVLPEHRAGSALDELTTGDERASAAAQQVAASLGWTSAEAETVAWERWQLPVADELARRMRISEELFTGEKRSAYPTKRLTDPWTVSVDTVGAARRRGWRGAHIQDMADELRNHGRPTRGGRR
jgi:transcriptional regulator with XRE-family HTH domain